MLHAGRSLRLQRKLLERATTAEPKLLTAWYDRIRRLSKYFQAACMDHALFAFERTHPNQRSRWRSSNHEAPTLMLPHTTAFRPEVAHLKVNRFRRKAATSAQLKAY